jgi:hypothetical protein
MVPGGCETRPSYGWPDKFDGEHPPRPERCKKHSLPGMEYMGSAARARKKRLLLETKEVRLRKTFKITGREGLRVCLCGRHVLPPSGSGLSLPHRSCAFLTCGSLDISAMYAEFDLLLQVPDAVLRLLLITFKFANSSTDVSSLP